MLHFRGNLIELLKFSQLLLSAFVDVSPEETVQKSPFESSLTDVDEITSFGNSQVAEGVSNCN